MFVHKESLFLNTGNTSPSWCDSCEVITNMALPWFQLRQSVPRETWLLGWFRCRIRIQHIICLFMLVIKLYIKRTWTQGIQDHIRTMHTYGTMHTSKGRMPNAHSTIWSQEHPLRPYWHTHSVTDTVWKHMCIQNNLSTQEGRKFLRMRWYMALKYIYIAIWG